MATIEAFIRREEPALPQQSIQPYEEQLNQNKKGAEEEEDVEYEVVKKNKPAPAQQPRLQKKEEIKWSAEEMEDCY